MAARRIGERLARIRARRQPPPAPQKSAAPAKSTSFLDDHFVKIAFSVFASGAYGFAWLYKERPELFIERLISESETAFLLNRNQAELPDDSDFIARPELSFLEGDPCTIALGGEKGSGKTAAMVHALREWQKDGFIVIRVDLSGATSPKDFAERLSHTACYLPLNTYAGQVPEPEKTLEHLLKVAHRIYKRDFWWMRRTGQRFESRGLILFIDDINTLYQKRSSDAESKTADTNLAFQETLFKMAKRARDDRVPLHIITTFNDPSLTVGFTEMSVDRGFRTSWVGDPESQAIAWRVTLKARPHLKEKFDTRVAQRGDDGPSAVSATTCELMENDLPFHSVVARLGARPRWLLTCFSDPEGPDVRARAIQVQEQSRLFRLMPVLMERVDKKDVKVCRDFCGLVTASRGGTWHEFVACYTGEGSDYMSLIRQNVVSYVPTYKDNNDVKDPHVQFSSVPIQHAWWTFREGPDAERALSLCGH